MAIIFFGQSYEENQFRKLAWGFIMRFKKKNEIDICTTIFHFAKRTVQFRRYRTVRLGAPAKFAILHGKSAGGVDFARVRYLTQVRYMYYFKKQNMLGSIAYVAV
jgi:hypothetical protein